MKRKLFLLVAILLPLCLSAQVNLHLTQKVSDLKSSTTKVMMEGGLMSENNFTYALFSHDFSTDMFQEMSYLQLSHETKFWKDPLYIHAEFRSTNLEYNQVLLGASYVFSTPHGILSVVPMYQNTSLNLNQGQKRWSWDNSSFMLSLTTEHDWNWVNVSSFTDIWTKNKAGEPAGIYSEWWIYFPVTEKIELGGITSFSVIDSKFDWAAFAGLKVKF